MVRDGSVPTPLNRACNTTLFYYTGSPVLPSVKSLLGDDSIDTNLLSPLSRVTLQVCFLYHCRIRELLNAVVGDVVHPDRVVLHGVKKSLSYVIFLPGLSSQLSYSPGARDFCQLFPISYIKLYRDSVRAGIRLLLDKSKYSRRLHSSRYQLCKSLDHSVSDAELSSILRHKSRSSILYYKP